jgi:hypothetical protein
MLHDICTFLGNFSVFKRGQNGLQRTYKEVTKDALHGAGNSVHICSETQAAGNARNACAETNTYNYGRRKDYLLRQGFGQRARLRRYGQQQTERPDGDDGCNERRNEWVAEQSVKV